MTSFLTKYMASEEKGETNAKVAVKSAPIPPINRMPPCHRRPTQQHHLSPPPGGLGGAHLHLARIRMEPHGTIRITARRRAPHTRGPGDAAPHHDHTISWPNLTAHCSGVASHKNQSSYNA